MVNGKLGTVLLIGMLVFVPLEMLTISNLGIGDFFTGLMMVTVWTIMYRQRHRFFIPLALGMWVIFLGSLIGSLSGLDIAATVVSFIQEVYLFLMFLTIANGIKDRPGLERLVKIWAIVAAVEAVIILLDFAGLTLPLIGGGTAKARVLGLDPATQNSGRAVGTFRNANAAGGFMMMTLFVMLAVPFTRSLWVRWGLPVLYGLAIMATGSIGAQLGTMGGLGVATLYWMHRKGRSNLFWLGLGASVVAAVALLTPVVMGRSAGLEFSTISRKLDKRLALWDRVDMLMADYPLGIGPNVTASVAVIGAHSDYVGFFSERGQLGFIGLFLLYAEIVFWLGLSIRYGKSWEELLAPGPFFGGMLGLMVMGVVHETFHGRPVWLMFAVIFIHYKLIREARRQSEVKRGSTSEAAVRVQPSTASLVRRLAD